MINSSSKIEKDFKQWDDWLKNIFINVQEIAKIVNNELPSYEGVLDKEDNVIYKMKNNMCKDVIERCDNFIKDNYTDDKEGYCDLCGDYKRAFKAIDIYCSSLDNMLKERKTTNNNMIIFRKILEIQALCRQSQKFNKSLEDKNNIVSEPTFGINI